MSLDLIPCLSAAGIVEDKRKRKKVPISVSPFFGRLALLLSISKH